MADNKNLKEKDLNNISGGWKLEGGYDEKTGKNTITFEYNDKEIDYIPGQLRNSLFKVNSQDKKSSGDVSNSCYYGYDDDGSYYP